MIRRIALWSLAGFIVACGWVLFTMATAPPMPSNHTFWTIVEITAPASLLRHFPLKNYWFVLLNALAYAVFGLAIELFRRKSVHHLAH